MKLYGRKQIRRFVDKRAERRVETRDAIVWDIDWTSYTCRVKIQGSAEYVRAHFPRNWKKRPYWLQRGNAVMIRHRQGVRGYIEVFGEGRAIPTPVEGPALPTPQAQPDMVLYGCTVSESTPPEMGVLVASGAYRIDGTTYYLNPTQQGYVEMDDPGTMIMGSADIMGFGLSSVALDAAPTTVGYWRYDALAVGIDGEIDYIKGVESTTPVKPAIPANHLQIGSYILIQYNDTSVDHSNIGALWVQKNPTTVEVTISGANIDANGYFDYVGGGGYPNPECTVRVAILDQYGEAMVTTTNGFTATLAIDSGTGEVWSTTSGWSGTSVSQSFTSYYDFKYRREEDASPEISPILKATLSLPIADIEQTSFIILLDNQATPEIIPFHVIS